ncbi:MAG: hypothetical protein R3362_00865 [Rhodothermales bacterium]|nr:hypothetical protein [Rhodothermales bacterium]
MTAEVIESSTRHFVAEVHRDAEAPEFGAWVEVETDGGPTLYGLVSHVETGSVEPGRRAVALGMDRPTLRREMPQVLELIRTTFRAQVLAYREPLRGSGRGRLHQTLPPRPAALHDAVRRCSDAAVCELAAPFDYLRTLVRHPDPAVPTDDLLVAVLRRSYRAHGGGEEGERVLLSAGRALSRLLDDDHERLQSILRRVV